MKEFFIKANEGTAYRCQARNVSQGQRRRFTDRCQSCSIWHFWLLGDQGLSAEIILKLSREKAITDVAWNSMAKNVGFSTKGRARGPRICSRIHEFRRKTFKIMAETTVFTVTQAMENLAFNIWLWRSWAVIYSLNRVCLGGSIWCN